MTETARAFHSTSEVEVAPLSDRDARILEFENRWWQYAGAKEQAIRELFDMSGAPFTEKLVPPAADTDASKAARTTLAATLAKLNPAGGILDDQNKVLPEVRRAVQEGGVRLDVGHGAGSFGWIDVCEGGVRGAEIDTDCFGHG